MLINEAQAAQAVQRQEARGHAGQQHVAARHQRAQLRQVHAVHLYKLLQVARARRAVRLRPGRKRRPVYQGLRCSEYSPVPEQGYQRSVLLRPQAKHGHGRRGLSSKCLIMRVCEQHVVTDLG